jgi:predicted transcriptional regulator
MYQKRLERKFLVFDKLKNGETKTTQMIAKECGITWFLAYMILTDLEREGKIEYVESGGKWTFWRIKDEKR